MVGTSQRVEHERAGQHRIQDEIISPNNDMFILHDSEGFERLNTPTYHVVRNFIEERCKRPELEEQLHAIWCVIISPSSRVRYSASSCSANLACRRLCSSLVGSSIFEKSDEEVLTRHNHRLFHFTRCLSRQHSEIAHSPRGDGIYKV